MKLYTSLAVFSLAFALAQAFAAPAGGSSGKTQAGKPGKVKVIVSPEAQKILDRHGASLRNGILRVRGSKKTYDIATGSGALRVIPDPKAPGALAIAAYDRGSRYAELRVEFPEPPFSEVALSPLPVTKEEADKLFPKRTD